MTSWHFHYVILPTSHANLPTTYVIRSYHDTGVKLGGSRCLPRRCGLSVKVTPHKFYADLGLPYTHSGVDLLP